MHLLEGLVLLLANLQATGILGCRGPARSEAQPICEKITVRTYGSNELACLNKKEERKKERKKEDEQFRDFAEVRLSTFATVSGGFEGPDGHGTADYEGQEPIKACN